MTGGVLAGPMQVTDQSVATLSGGAVSGPTRVELASSLKIGGEATVLNQVVLGSDSSLSLTGGRLEGTLLVNHHGFAEVSGGELAGGFQLLGGALTLSGGEVSGPVWADRQGEFHLVAQQLLIDGVDVSGALPIGVATPILERDVTLSGLLADGSSYEYVIGGSMYRRENFNPGLVTVTIAIPEPLTAAILGPALLALLTSRQTRRVHAQHRPRD